MFLFQKLNYNKEFYDSVEPIAERIKKDQPKIIVFDTETTGLNIIKDKPFLIAFGYDKNIFIFEPTKEKLELIYDAIKNVKDFQGLYAHNAKYDWHMLHNTGAPLPEDIPIGDTMVVARITEYSDSMGGISLEELGGKYVDPEAKMASKVIKQHINQINRERLGVMKKAIKLDLKLNKLSEVVNAYYNRVQFIPSEFDELFTKIDKIYKIPNYKDSYEANPNLMISYLADDIVLTIEYFKKALPILTAADPDYKTLTRENDLIKIVGAIERIGLRVDKDYLIASRSKLLDYQNKLYDHLFEKTGQKFSSGQHKVIMKLFKDKYNVSMNSADIKALEDIMNTNEGDANEVAKTILELRTVDKWLSTYIEGMLNRIYEGRIYTNINNAGAITGRVSSDLQQQPKDALVDRDGNELFHPRRVFVNDDNSRTFYFDFSQMELRVQAHYTLILGDGDLNLTRAFIPYKCKSMFTGKEFDYTKDDWRSKEWIDENGKDWEPTDLHSATTLQAFPHLKTTDPNFGHFRSLGKRANFAKNYGAGWAKLMEALKISEEIAKALDSGYNKAFPKVKDYQRWVERQLQLYGYVENLYGRRYYVSSQSNFYKGYNYLIQGSCADLMKIKEIEIAKFLKTNNLKSKMILPIHDEIQISIPADEEWIVSEIKQILDDNNKVIHTLPMICEVEVTNTAWADKEDYEELQINNS
jgi:DNA polymerase-1